MTTQCMFTNLAKLHLLHVTERYILWTLHLLYLKCKPWYNSFGRRSVKFIRLVILDLKFILSNVVKLNFKLLNNSAMLWMLVPELMKIKAMLQ